MAHLVRRDASTGTDRRTLTTEPVRVPVFRLAGSDHRCTYTQRGVLCCPLANIRGWRACAPRPRSESGTWERSPTSLSSPPAQRKEIGVSAPRTSPGRPRARRSRGALVARPSQLRRDRARRPGAGDPSVTGASSRSHGARASQRRATGGDRARRDLRIRRDSCGSGTRRGCCDPADGQRGHPGDERGREPPARPRAPPAEVRRGHHRRRPLDRRHDRRSPWPAGPTLRSCSQDGRARATRSRRLSRPPPATSSVMLDADGSTDPAEIPRFVGALTTGADFARDPGSSPAAAAPTSRCIRRAGNWVLTTLVNRLSAPRSPTSATATTPSGRRPPDAVRPRLRRLRGRDADEHPRGCLGHACRGVPSYEASRRHGTSNLKIGRDGTRVIRTILAEWLRP